MTRDPKTSAFLEEARKRFPNDCVTHIGSFSSAEAANNFINGITLSQDSVIVRGFQAPSGSVMLIIAGNLSVEENYRILKLATKDRITDFKSTAAGQSGILNLAHANDRVRADAGISKVGPVEQPKKSISENVKVCQVCQEVFPVPEQNKSLIKCQKCGKWSHFSAKTTSSQKATIISKSKSTSGNNEKVNWWYLIIGVIFLICFLCTYYLVESEFKSINAPYEAKLRSSVRELKGGNLQSAKYNMKTSIKNINELERNFSTMRFLYKLLFGGSILFISIHLFLFGFSIKFSSENFSETSSEQIEENELSSLFEKD